MQIRNVTKFTKEVGREYHKVHYRMRIMRFQIIFTLLFLIGSAIFFWKGMLSTGIVFASLTVALNLLLGGIYFFTILRHRKAFDFDKAPTFIYDFYENTMNAEFVHESQTACTSYSYKALFGVAITKKIILLFASPVKAFILDKEGFSSGTCEEFINILKQQLPPNRIKNI